MTVTTRKRSYPGFLIIFEGTDGTGKSTQLQLLAQALTKRNWEVVTTREPTTGPYGMKIRELYVNRQAGTPEQELSLFIADRREHISELILPSLQAGKVVLCDRYYLSTAAYQGALGFDPETIMRQHDFAPEPDLALIFAAPPDLSLRRIKESRGEQPNDFEKLESLQKVANIFAALDRPYIRRINAALAIQQVHEQVMAEVIKLLGSNPTYSRE